MSLIKCPECDKEISSNAANCPHCGNPFSHEIRCPNCNSGDISKISNASKVGSAVLFGVFAMGKLTKTYQCLQCKFKW